MGALATFANDGNFLPGVVVLFEFVKNRIDEVIESGNDLELDSAEDWAFERLGERFFDFAGSGKL